MNRAALPLALVAALAVDAGANGRPPATSTIHFRKGAEQHIAAGMTFGLLVSDDGGATWYWMCEKAVNYGGLYDPSYTYTSSGALFATTFSPGLSVRRDMCTFAETGLGIGSSGSGVFVSQTALGSDGHVYASAADSTDSKIYESSDDGATFPQAVAPPTSMNGDWWSSLTVAPSDATRVYVSGYRFNGNNPKTFEMFKSINGGQTFTAMTVNICGGAVTTNCFMVSQNSEIDIVGVSPTDPNVIYARSTLENGVAGDGIYMSTNGGTTWTGVLHKTDSLYLVARRDGSVVVGSQTQGSYVNTTPVATPTTWTALTNPPHINCLTENSAGEVWACTQNYGVAGVPSDGFGIMKSKDLSTWTGVLKFQDITAPVTCPAGTNQQDMCVAPFQGMPSIWCVLRVQLGITSTGGITCPSFVTDTAGDITVVTTPRGKGCCEAGGDAGAPIAFGIGFAVLLLRPRRKLRS